MIEAPCRAQSLAKIDAPPSLIHSPRSNTYMYWLGGNEMLDSRPWYQFLSQPLGRLRERFLGWYQFLSQL